MRLDHAGPYRPGEAITGTVCVRGGVDLSKHRVWVGLGYQVQLKNHMLLPRVERWWEVVAESVLRESGGDATDLAFALPMPNGPVAYRGHHLEVEWSVAAWVGPDAQRTALRGSLTRPTCWEPITLIAPHSEGYLAGPGPREATLHAAAWRSDATRGMGGRVGFTVLVLCGLAVVCSGALAALGAGLAATASVPYWLALVLGYPAVLTAVFVPVWLPLALLMLWLAHRDRLAVRGLGEVVVELTPAATQPGGEVMVRVDLCPKADVTVREIRAVLIGREHVAWHNPRRLWAPRVHRIHSGMARHTVCEMPVHIARDIDLSRGERRTWSTRLGIPTAAPLSFEHENLALEWLVEVQVIRPRLTWRRTVCLQVGPAELE